MFGAIAAVWLLLPFFSKSKMVEMNNGLKFILLFALSLYSYCSFAQSGSPLYIESQFGYGFVAKHKPSLAEVTGGYIKTGEINIGLRSIGKKDWQQLYRYPSLGLGYIHIDLANPEKLGAADALYGYACVPILSTKRFELNYQINLGLGWLTKGNVAISTHVNAFLNFGVDTKLKLSDRLYLINGFGGFHFSNGAWKVPNLGLNAFTYRIGFRYLLNGKDSTRINRQIAAFVPHNKFKITFGTGTKQTQPEGGPQFMAYNISIAAARSVSYKRDLELGADIFIDPSLRRLYEQDGQLDKSLTDCTSIGLHLGHTAYLDKLGIMLNVGGYIRNPYDKRGYVYERIGIQYWFNKNIFANIGLKAHLEVADNFEFGFGFAI